MSRPSDRRVLLLVHPRRADASDLGRAVAERLGRAGVAVVALEEDLRGSLGAAQGVSVAHPAHPANGCELVVILGGDGTILRGAEVSRGSGVPILGVNLGQVGFLAEVERHDIGTTVEAILDRAYGIEERLTLEVTVGVDGDTVFSSWALNEVTVEKASRERMIELTIEIDGRPLSTWGGDGIVMATPTGSTAYAFSAGGPVVWPDVEALLLVPISAHALFSRPLVVGPDSHLAVEVVPHTDGIGVVSCDGRRGADLPPGARISVQRSPLPVRLVRLTEAPFTDRLVEKFDLPVRGWRGARRGAVRPARA
ncbi:MAG TPA: NAD kinase [Dermatophilaceae bacterium]|nr:NAD kinase [Dermatophilaceae bacterium]